jgi:hypothetical protein
VTEFALTYVEIDVDYCSLTYGTAPCTASIPTTGAAKCFNTRASCQDIEHFANAPVTLRFAVQSGHNPVEIEALPFIVAHSDVSITPGRISLGEDLGQRESVSVTLAEYPHADTGPGFDKYLADRDYDPFSQGSFWAKFRARQPYLKGRAFRLYRGFVGQALAEMECRHYLIDSYTGPGADGRFTIVAKDILKLLDGDQAQAPVLSKGSLAGDITIAATSATLTPVGIGNTSNYGSAGKVAIGAKEVVSYYRDPLAGNDASTKLLLHFDGTDAATAFTDSSASARTVTAVGNAQLDTAKQKFGTASLLLDGTGDYATLPDSADWTFGAGATIDACCWLNALPALSTICSHATDANNQYRWTVSSTGVIAFTVISASVTIISLSSAAGVIATGQFYHLELVKNGNDYTIRVDGVAVATVTDADAIPNFTSTFKIGADGGATNFFNGWIDEFRFSAVARHTADFTPPAAPYNTSADILTLTARGLNGTDAAAHEAGDRVQVCIEYLSEDPASIVADLMTSYGGIDPDWIPLETWVTETDTFNRRLYSGIIAEPTPVRTLIQEMIVQAGLAIWWDPVLVQVFLQVLRAVTADARVFDETVIMGQLSIAEQPDKRVSQVWVYFGQRNPLEGQDDPNNYRSSLVVLDTTAEANYGSAAIQKLYSRWIAFGGLTTAERIGNLQLGRYVNPPRKFAFNLLRSDDNALVLGVGYYVKDPELQNFDGSRATVPVQVTRMRSDADQFGIEAEENSFTSYDTDDSLTVVIDSSVRSVNLRSLFDALYTDPIAGDHVNFIVNEQVVVGSTSSTVPAIDVGSWPSVNVTGNRTNGSPIITGIASTAGLVAGMPAMGTGIPAGTHILSVDSGVQITLDANATSGASTSTVLTIAIVILTLDLRGRLSGAGGMGGLGGRGLGDQAGRAGLAGGTALLTRYPIAVIIATLAKLYGGGGGGGGAGTRNYDDHNGGGGGGGAGDSGGIGGAKGRQLCASGFGRDDRCARSGRAVMDDDRRHLLLAIPHDAARRVRRQSGKRGQPRSQCRHGRRRGRRRWQFDRRHQLRRSDQQRRNPGSPGQLGQQHVIGTVSSETLVDEAGNMSVSSATIIEVRREAIGSAARDALQRPQRDRPRSRTRSASLSIGINGIPGRSMSSVAHTGFAT